MTTKAAAASASGGYVDLTPSDSLRFVLTAAGQSRTTLKLTNISDQKVAFKVKTTQPQRYFVRPNQGVLAEDASETIQIILAEKQCRELLLSAARGQAEVNQDRFLVLSIGIDDASYEHISSLSTDQKADELSKLWDATKKDEKDARGKDKRGKKLSVEYEYPEDLQAVVGRLMETTQSTEGGPEAQGGRPSGVDTSARVTSLEAPGSPEAIFAELQATRKKYDAVVEYTVTLTAERDMLNNKVEELQRDLARLRNRAGAEGDASRLRATSTTEKAQQTGFQLFHLCLCALIFFLLGKFLRLE